MTVQVFQLTTSPGEVQNGLYRKEVVPTGHMKDGKGTRFFVDESRLSHWAYTHGRMLEAGHRVPSPMNHTFDPDKNRGFVKDLRVESNSKGEPSLFGYFELDDPKLAKTDVSIFVESEFEDAKGNKFRDVIRHVALTDYPMVPGMDGFTLVMAATPEDPDTMKVKELLKKYKVTPKEGESEEDALQAYIDGVTAKAKEIRDDIQSDPPKADDDPPPADPPAVPKNEPEMIAASAVLPLVQQNRTARIKGLLDSRKITKAQHDALIKQYVPTGESISLSSLQADGFDSAMTVFELASPIADDRREKTGLQRTWDEGQNPVVNAARKRAEAAKK